MTFKTISSLTLLAIALSGLTACSTTDMQAYTTGGSAVSTSEVKYAPTNSQHVKLYYGSDRCQRHYKIIGRVSASNDNLMGIPHSAQTVDNKLKEEAASLGADAVIDITSNLENTAGQAVVYQKGR